MNDDALLQQEVARVQSSGVLGEARLRSLFDYLAKNTLASQSPKEIAIAMDVFGKGPEFDVSQDALVRVYIHKLRKALGDFYASRASERGAVLHVPRGDYRLKVNSIGASAPPSKAWLKDRRSQLYLAVGAVLLLGLGFVIAQRWTVPTEIEQVRANPIWCNILMDDRPIMIILGDYYLIGETDGSVDVKRLIREYSINSKSDLDSFVAAHPEFGANHLDVGIHYLPVSAALALRSVMVALAPQNRRITVTQMSALEPGSLKTADIIYIGYLSGMGMLQDMAFSGSRLAIGNSYDEVIDKKTQHTYVSQVGSQLMSGPSTDLKRAYRDYGIFEKLQGPGGNTILVISGTRDEGVEQTAEAFTNAQTLSELSPQTDARLPFEALLEVRAFNGTNLTGALLLQSNRDKTMK